MERFEIFSSSLFENWLIPASSGSVLFPGLLAVALITSFSVGHSPLDQGTELGLLVVGLGRKRACQLAVDCGHMSKSSMHIVRPPERVCRVSGVDDHTSIHNSEQSRWGFHD